LKDVVSADFAEVMTDLLTNKKLFVRKVVASEGEGELIVILSLDISQETLAEGKNIKKIGSWNERFATFSDMLYTRLIDEFGVRVFKGPPDIKDKTLQGNKRQVIVTVTPA